MATTYEPIEYDPTKYEVNYDDAKFTAVTNKENAAVAEAERTYGEMVAGTDKVYNDLKESTQKWADTQTDIQNQQTEHTIQQIEQQKEYARKDYEKEQAGAYVDWRKQSNQYGTEAEKMASAGLANTGYSESSQVSMYNTYQNRIAIARESFQRSCDNFANQITEAKLQNNAALAEIALTAFEKQAQYSLEAFQYKNQLILDLQDKKLELQKFYADEWQRALDQVNIENNRLFQYDQQQNQFAFEANQAELNRDFEATQAELDRAWKSQEAEIDRKFEAEQKELDRKYDEAQAELDRKHDLALVKANTQAAKEKADHEYKLAMQKLAQEHKNDLAILDKQLANEKATAKYKYELEKQKTTFSTGSTGSNSKTAAALKIVTNPSYKTNKTTSINYESKIKNITTYNQAAAFAKHYGFTFGAMTLSEWSRRRNAGSTATEAKYTSYEAYIQDYCRYLASKSKK